MSAKTSSRRRRQRESAADQHILRISVDDGRGHVRWLTADLRDYSSGGVGVALAAPLTVGSEVRVTGLPGTGASRRKRSAPARVAWCLERPDGSFRAGLELEDSDAGPEQTRTGLETETAAAETEDYYEILQVSPNAHPDTIHRVFKILAQRFHPDNPDTGEEETFKRILAAYNVLKDPEQRAAYDARRESRLRARWRIFRKPAEAAGPGAERRKRYGILQVLYHQRVHEPEFPALSIHDLEDLLGCPRDHLQFSLWYLKEKGYIRRDDRARYSITVAGIDEAEAAAAPRLPAERLLRAPSGAGPGQA